MQRILRSIALPLAFASCEALAFGIGLPPPETTVIEYQNTRLDHYFLTADPNEAAGLDRGVAGAEWVRTGRGFRVYASVNDYCNGCVPVARFFAPGPVSHFFTENSEESAILQQPDSGWRFETGSAFVAVPPQPGGSCPAAAPVPVTRFYNMRWMFNDSNHRFVTRASDRAELLAKGWVDEGVHFCALAAEEIALKAFAIDAPLDGNVLPSAECEDESRRVGPCVAVNNLPVPRTPLNLFTMGADAYRFSRLTDIYSDGVFVESPGGAERADGPFVQLVGTRYGIHVDTLGKSATELASINPLYQFHTGAADGAARFFPWRSAYPFETELSIASLVTVKKITARNADSHAYGHPTVEFIDTRSGQHVYFTVLGYGWVVDDFLARDAGTGKVIVGTMHRANTRYGRSLGSDTLITPPGFEGTAFGSFDFRMARSEFVHVLESARSLNPALSADPDDYLIDNFHYNNEVAGDGEIGLNVALTLKVMRR